MKKLQQQQQQKTHISSSSNLIFFLFVSFHLSLLPHASSCKAWLVQSIPTDMPHLPPVPGILSSADVLRWLAGNSTRNLDIVAQYWELIAEPGNPKSGDYGYSKADMERFGSKHGQRVYKSIENAADRKVNIRILQHSGVYPNFDKESADLAAGRPNVKNVTLLLRDWWGSGIVHAKVWISDGKDIYIGSANNDWKSLTQVKELGIYLVGCSRIAKEVEVYYNNLWKLANLNSSSYTKVVWDKEWQIRRKVPCWSHFVRSKERCRSPLPGYIKVHHVPGYPALSDPYMFRAPIATPSSNKSTSRHHASYLSFAPPEGLLGITTDPSAVWDEKVSSWLSFGKFQTDEQGWLDTIKSVKLGGTVRISTMDWLGQSQFSAQQVYWNSLSSAISEVVFSKHATVKILVAYWAHFIENTDQYLKSLLYSNILCSSSKYNKCAGKVEVKYYRVPGFNLTGTAKSKGNSTGNIYPGYTRVNHGKFAVSDIRAHIGTSNLVWDYFYTTAGVSFGTYNSVIVFKLQEIFEADWNSPYALPVEPLENLKAT